ncbi:MAG: DUF423 domain-containing protein [Flavobacteriaceae bacterium]|jgi:uncharacterized membrane protein YgdD (TMEM256/DUF423 family)|nr:DUF423 domain-containing protein [Flavobacteriaceae bacterium]
MEIQNQLAIIAGSTLGMLAVIFGAFGAHALKKRMSAELLVSFETGVRYQMYHALLLCFISILSLSDFTNLIVNLILIGTILFSFSIYGLCLSATFGKKIKLFGPITPIGGLLLVGGWFMLLYSFFVK